MDAKNDLFMSAKKRYRAAADATTALAAVAVTELRLSARFTLPAAAGNKMHVGSSCSASLSTIYCLNIIIELKIAFCGRSM